MPEHANLLRLETSPYLLQHADNPVHWRPWGAAALSEAAEADKPIMLSIGYAACHWCHVMAHESFEDPQTAALMNTLFVNIKVDREERPDIDHLYMSALHALGEQGGWPLTMFLAPDGSPFWGGTYFPPEPRWGRPSFRQVLQGVAAAYREGDKMVAQNTGALRRYLQSQAQAQTGDLPTPAHLDAVAKAYLGLNDAEHGGLKGAPKFPNPPIFRFLWQNAFRTGDPAGQDALHLMLERMSQGGIYDHLGGGYSRYSTDAVWLVPHFEKMLYDNAQLLDLLALAHAHRPSPLYAARAAETVAWMTRDMTAQRVDGRAAFAASEDADSEGEEGKFYVWTEADIDSLLGADAATFKRAYDVTPAGNWEGHTILRRVTSEGSPAEEAALARSRGVLFQARSKRIRPGRDDKVLADWNGLAIAALARAAAVFDHPEWLARAEEAFDFVLTEMGAPDGRVQHAWRLGRVTAVGLLDDQAAMARAALALFEATGDAARLAQAERIVRATEAKFADGHGGFYTTADDATDVPLARPRTAADNATPAGAGIIAEVFARLFHLTGDDAWRARTEATLRAFTDVERISGMPGILSAADLLEEAATVVIAGDPADPRVEQLAAPALRAPDSTVVVLRASRPDVLPAGHPAHGKGPVAGAPAAYVCRRNVCGLPITDAAALSRSLHARS
ncbi:MAG TPA: thioredoxin domain-containing protein [Acetobacteraceae bacterium]|nr:thioredoxin domain-containing protein [Acetobacteraceae bacterium]